MQPVQSLEHARAQQDSALNAMGLFRYRIPEDGNCMFRAVAAQLRLDQVKYHPILRQATATWMRQHASQLLAEGVMEKLSEIEETTTEGAWPGQAALVALANVLHVNIAVVQGGDIGKADIQHVTPYEDDSSSDMQSIILAYLYNGHYDAVIQDPSVPNPDYALWAAECNFNNAVSEVMARKLNEESGLPSGNYSAFTSGNNASKMRGSSKLQYDENAQDKNKVSTMKIDLKSSENGSLPNKSTIRNTNHDAHHNGYSKDHRRPSIENVKGEVIKKNRHSVLRLSKSDADGNIAGHDLQHPPARRTRSELRDNPNDQGCNSRRRSSSGVSKSPYHQIVARIENDARRRGSRERELEIDTQNSSSAYGYDGSIRRPSSENRKHDSHAVRQYSAPASPNYGYNSRMFGATSPFEKNRSLSPSKVYNKDQLRKAVVERKSSCPSEMNRKTSFGVDLTPVKSDNKYKSEAEQTHSNSDVVVHSKLKNVKQVSLSKDFGKSREVDKEILNLKERRSSEGNNVKKTKKIHEVSNPSRFGVDYSTKKRDERMSKQNMSSQAISKTAKQPPALLPKPKVKSKDIYAQSDHDYLSESAILLKDVPPEERRRKDSKGRILIIPVNIGPSNGHSHSPDRESHSDSHSRRDSRHRTRQREGENFLPGYHKVRVRSRDRQIQYQEDGHNPPLRTRQQRISSTGTTIIGAIDTDAVVTTPPEPVKTGDQRMPFVGHSPSETRKVNVQVSTEDYDYGNSSLNANGSVNLPSPHKVRSLMPSSASVGVGSDAPMMMMMDSSSGSATSPASAITVINNSQLDRSKPPMPLNRHQGSHDNLRHQGISRVLPQHHVQIPLRPADMSGSGMKSNETVLDPSVLMQYPRRRSVCEIQPLQNTIVSSPSCDQKKSSIEIPITHFKSNSEKIEMQHYRDGRSSGHSSQNDHIDIDELLQENLYL